MIKKLLYLDDRRRRSRGLDVDVTAESVSQLLDLSLDVHLGRVQEDVGAALENTCIKL